MSKLHAASPPATFVSKLAGQIQRQHRDDVHCLISMDEEVVWTGSKDASIRQLRVQNMTPSGSDEVCGTSTVWQARSTDYRHWITCMSKSDHGQVLAGALSLGSIGSASTLLCLFLTYRCPVAIG